MPISVPPYMPMRQEVRPNIDIGGSIAGLGDALQQGMEFGQKRRVDKATRQAFADPVYNPDGTMNFAAMAGKIAQTGGDIDTALTLTRLAETQTQNEFLRGKPTYLGGPRGSQYLVGGAGDEPQQIIPPEPDSPIIASPGSTVIDPSGKQPPITVPDRPEKTKPRRLFKTPDNRVIDEDTGEEVIPAPAVDKSPKPKAPTIDAMRNKQLLSVVTPELATIETTFAELSKPENQVGALAPGGLGNYATSPGYQRGRNALRTIIASYLYSMSGATANPSEVETQTDVLMPRLGEADTSVADKLARIRVMVDSIKTRSGGSELTGSPDNAAPAADEPEQQDSPQEDAAEPQQQEEGQIVEMNDGRRFRLMPDGTVIQLD